MFSLHRSIQSQDLDLLIGHMSHIGILTTADLSKYYHQFLLISCYLISMNCLSTHEQSRSFFHGLQPSLEACVWQHLQQKFIDHLPDNPFEINTVYKVVRYILMRSTSMGVVQVLLPLPPQVPNPPVAITTSTLQWSK